MWWCSIPGAGPARVPVAALSRSAQREAVDGAHQVERIVAGDGLMAEFHELVRFVAGRDPDTEERPVGGCSGGREAPRAALRGDPAGSAGGGRSRSGCSWPAGQRAPPDDL